MYRLYVVRRQDRTSTAAPPRCSLHCWGCTAVVAPSGLYRSLILLSTLPAGLEDRLHSLATVETRSVPCTQG